MTKGDYQLFELGRKNVNIISDYYFKSPTTGTYWRPESEDPTKARIYSAMFDAWKSAGKPEDEITLRVGKNNKPTNYKIRHEGSNVIFHYHHGWLFQPWQLAVHHCPKPDILVIAGFGSGKTAMMIQSMAIRAMTTPNFTGFIIAPRLTQAMQSYKYLITNAEDTLFGDRFMYSTPQKPFPQIIMKSDYIGTSTIEFFGVLDDTEKLRTIEGDMIGIEQMERFDDLAKLFRDAGSRLRGHVQGRERLGKILGIANAGSNPDMWWMFEQGIKNKDDPNYPVASFRVKTTDNIYLTKKDIENMKRRVSVDGNGNVAQWMDAERPIGDGEHFSHKMLKMNFDEAMNDYMDVAIKQEKPGFDYREGQRAGTVLWECPPDFRSNRKYCVIGDPGQSNPPYRNSPVIMVWDYTDFPKRPAFLRCFSWVYGNGSYQPFIDEFIRLVEKYRAHQSCAFDSTGQQSAFDQLVFQSEGFLVEGMNMAGNNKSKALNSAKVIMGQGLLKMPHLDNIESQLVNYKLPDTRIRQDIVSVIIMSSDFLNRFFYIKDDGSIVDSYGSKMEDNGHSDDHWSSRYKRKPRKSGRRNSRR